MNPEPSRPPESGPTKTNEILELLRDDIINVRLKPGERLRFDELRHKYTIGISPLREALTQLASEGLVVSEQRKGYRVAPVNEGDLYEIAKLRGELDSLAIRESIRNGDEAWEGRILAAFHGLQKRKKLGPDGSVDADWETYHLRFHYELVSECRLPKLIAFRSILTSQARRYLRIAVHYLSAPRDDVAEHRALRDAVLDRDAETAGALIRSHYDLTVQIILSKNDTMRLAGE